jgi:hypothetical protein
MNVLDFRGRKSVHRLKYEPRDVPHATVETNRTCNILCRSCYNLDRASVKSLKEIRNEIDILASRRKLHVLSLLGGEPTLHPDLFAIIAHVKSKGIICQLLTNGLVLLGDTDGTFVDRATRSGLDRILVHIDSGQAPVHGDIEHARRELFARLDAKGIHFALSLTVYNEDGGSIAAQARKYAAYPRFDGILAVLAREPLPPVTQNVRLEDEYGALLDDPGLEPAAYIPSSLSDNDVNWLFYAYFIDSMTGRTISLSPRADRVFRRVYRILRGREAFILTLSPALAGPASLIAALGRTPLRPSNWILFWELLGPALFTRRIRFQYIAIQDPPEYDEKRNALRICWQCPDATIRNGRLTPICIADKINPRPGFAVAGRWDHWGAAVFGHLGEP